jgi:uncharacterized protein YeaO (DUF488 family)
MNLHTYRYGASPQTGLSIGVAHYVPRGVRHEDYAAKGYFDVWVPLLSPSKELVAVYRDRRISPATFARRYRTEMRNAPARQAIRLIAAMALHQRVSLGCFCERDDLCHRSVLRELIIDASEELPSRSPVVAKFSSPACSMPEIED